MRAVREMHQPSAVGTATAPSCGIEWTSDVKAIIRAKISDDQAWKKIKDGVYKGFSVGVRPIMMRGNNVEKCAWVENSLVNRPKDPMPPITMWRAVGADMDAESDVEVKDVQRGLLPSPCRTGSNPPCGMRPWTSCSRFSMRFRATNRV